MHTHKKLVYLLVAFLICGFSSHLFSQTLNGTVKDAESGEPLIGATVFLATTGQGTSTDVDGQFTMNDLPGLPFQITISYTGYQPYEGSVESTDGILEINLQSSITLEEVVVKEYYSTLNQKVSLTIESLGLRDIQSVSEASFYDAAANLREVDLLTVSFGIKVINARGFNSSTPIRSLQLIDGVDNASPGLNYPLGNFMGLPDLDAEGMDLVIGASSSYFGPGAFNGVINLRSKSPFNHPGLEIQLKAGQRNYLDGAFRYAHVFKNKKGQDKLGIKLNGSYARIDDWQSNNANPSRGALEDSIGVDNLGGYDAVNRYGDEPNGDLLNPESDQSLFPGLGKFYRTGYWEKDVANYNSYNLKTSGAVHYLFRPDVELIASANYGRGTTVMQLDNRLSLNDVWATQYRLELRQNDRFFFRVYRTKEDAGDTYDIVATAEKIQNFGKSDGLWIQNYEDHWFVNYNAKVRAFEGFPQFVPFQPFDFEQLRKVLAENQDSLAAWHQATREAVDGSYLQPGTSEFQEAFDLFTGTSVAEGGTRYIDRSQLYHAHGQYQFKPRFLDDLTVGGNYRYYAPESEGTIFVDTAGTEVRTYEYGAYIGADKRVADEHLKLNVAVRLDKHENYDFLVSPSFSAIYNVDEFESIRFSMASALRNPTLIEQYYFFRVGSATLLGNITGYYDMLDFDSFLVAVRNQDLTRLDTFSVDPLRPEKALAMEVAYSNVFFDKLAFRSTAYYNRYRDFIGYRLGVEALFAGVIPQDVDIFRFPANAQEITSTAGVSVGLDFYLNKQQTVAISGNYSWNTLIQKKDDPLIPAYNTPAHKFNINLNLTDLQIGNQKGWGGGFNFRWVGPYTFESSPQFTGRIGAQYFVNGQISKTFEPLKSTIKISGSNLLDRRQNGLYGGPDIGRFVFISWYFNL